MFYGKFKDHSASVSAASLVEFAAVVRSHITPQHTGPLMAHCRYVAIYIVL